VAVSLRNGNEQYSSKMLSTVYTTNISLSIAMRFEI